MWTCINDVRERIKAKNPDRVVQDGLLNELDLLEDLLNMISESLDEINETLNMEIVGVVDLQSGGIDSVSGSIQTYGKKFNI